MEGLSRSGSKQRLDTLKRRVYCRFVTLLCSAPLLVTVAAQAAPLTPPEWNGLPQDASIRARQSLELRRTHAKASGSAGNYNSTTRGIVEDVLPSIDDSVPFTQTEQENRYHIYGGGRSVPIGALFHGVTTEYSHTKEDRQHNLREYYEANWLAPTVIQEAASKVTDPAVGIGVEAARKRAETHAKHAFLNTKRTLAIIEFLQESETFAEAFMWCVDAALALQNKDHEGNDLPETGTSYLEAQSACAMDFLQGGGLFRPISYVIDRLTQRVVMNPLDGQEGFNFNKHPANYFAPESLIGARPVTGILINRDPGGITPAFSNDITLSAMIFHHEGRFLETVSLTEPISGRKLPIYFGFLQRINYTLMRDDFRKLIGDIEWKFSVPVAGIISRYFLQNLFRDGEVRIVQPEFRPSEFYQGKIATKVEDLVWILYRHCKAIEYIAANATSEEITEAKGSIWEILQGQGTTSILGSAGIPQIEDEDFIKLSLPSAPFTLATAKGFWGMYYKDRKGEANFCQQFEPINTSNAGINWNTRLERMKTAPDYNIGFWRAVYSHARLAALGEILLMIEVVKQAVDSTAFSLTAGDKQIQMAKSLIDRAAGRVRTEDSLSDIAYQLNELLEGIEQSGKTYAMDDLNSIRRRALEGAVFK